jgi:DNA (cytosine-5)-methyltransferase 1
LIRQVAFGGNHTSGPIDISTAINACSTASGRIDFETETFVAHSLYADGWDAGEDGTGRGTPLVSMALYQPNEHGQHPEMPKSVAFNLRGRGGGAMPEMAMGASLRSALGGSSNSYVAFSSKDYRADCGEVAPTLRGMGHDTSHANAGGQLAIAFSANQRGEVRERDVHGSINSGRSGKQIDGVMQESVVAAPLAASYAKQIDSSDTSNGPNLLRSTMGVRRLTPRECERLQGYPDDYTLVSYRGKPASDGPRYKALGNSMAVPVMHWIGTRIAFVDKVLNDGLDIERLR